MIDDADFWAEEIDGTGHRYRVDGRWRPLRDRDAGDPAAGRGADASSALRRTHRGPIFTDVVPGWPGAPLSLRICPARARRGPAGLPPRRARDVCRRDPDGDRRLRSPRAEPAHRRRRRRRRRDRLMGRVPLRPPADATPSACWTDARRRTTGWGGSRPTSCPRRPSAWTTRSCRRTSRRSRTSATRTTSRTSTSPRTAAGAFAGAWPVGMTSRSRTWPPCRSTR